MAAFEAVAESGAAAYRWATLCFFGGMLIIVVLDKVGAARMGAACCLGAAGQTWVLPGRALCGA